MDSPDIRIVLVAPSHPGNIGAVARAMKNMALHELLLVQPKEFPHPEARARASGADDVLTAARAVASLGGALDGRGVGAARTPAGPPLAGAQEMARLYAHFAQVLEEIEFRDRTQSGTHLMGRIRRFLQRAELDQNEVNILRGILTAVQSRRRHAGAEPP